MNRKCFLLWNRSPAEPFLKIWNIVKNIPQKHFRSLMFIHWEPIFLFLLKEIKDCETVQPVQTCTYHSKTFLTPQGSFWMPQRPCTVAESGLALRIGQGPCRQPLVWWVERWGHSLETNLWQPRRWRDSGYNSLWPLWQFVCRLWQVSDCCRVTDLLFSFEN